MSEASDVALDSVAAVRCACQGVCACASVCVCVLVCVSVANVGLFKKPRSLLSYHA